MTEPRQYHVLATFDDHGLLLDGVVNATSWVIIDEEAALRALNKPLELPPVSHVHVTVDGVTTIKRLNDITLEQAREVIRRLCDELLERP